MKFIRAAVLQFVANDSGAAAIEYGLLAAGISLAIINTIDGLAMDLQWTWQQSQRQAHGDKHIVEITGSPLSGR